jgi:amino acid transporter
MPVVPIGALVAAVTASSRVLQAAGNRARSTPAPERSAFQRAKVATKVWVGKAPIIFGLLTTLCAGVAAAYVAIVTGSDTVGTRVLLAAAALVVGYLVIPTIVWVFFWIDALLKPAVGMT